MITPENKYCFMRRAKTPWLCIAVLVFLLLVPYGLSAAKPVQPQPKTVSTEREQQFTYYWYAARQAIDREQYSDALALLLFCNAIKPGDGTTLCFLGVIYDGLNQKELALDMFRQAYEADPRDQWYKYSNALLELRTPDGWKQALQVLQNAATLNPNNEELLAQLLRMYVSDGEWKKALSTMDRIDAIKGYDAYSALTRYGVYVRWGKAKKAIGALDKYLEQDPTNIQFLIFRMQILEQIGARPAELYAMYEKILQLDPHNLGVLNNYAYYLATHRGDLKKAERMSELTIREEPDNPVYLDTYGWILGLQGQYNLAIFYIDKAERIARTASPASLPVIDEHKAALVKAQQKALKNKK